MHEFRFDIDAPMTVWVLKPGEQEPENAKVLDYGWFRWAFVLREEGEDAASGDGGGESED